MYINTHNILYLYECELQILIPIYNEVHFMLIAISLRINVILVCDSILPDGEIEYLSKDAIKDIKSFLDYHYEGKVGKWRVEYVRDEDCFQDVTFQSDCGYHLLNFAEGAINDRRRVPPGNAFTEFKNFMASKVQKYMSKKKVTAKKGSRRRKGIKDLRKETDNNKQTANKNTR